MPLRAYERFSPTTEHGPYRVEDYLALPDDTERCELLCGNFYLTPAPSVPHQVVLGVLFLQFDAIARAAGGRALLAPTDVVLSRDTVCQPDMIYISKERLGIRSHARLEDAPDLVVEIVSPSTSRRDRIEKLRIYRDADVREYWMIDPEGRSFEFLDLSGEDAVVRLAGGDVYESPVLPEVRLDLVDFWHEVEERLV